MASIRLITSSRRWAVSLGTLMSDDTSKSLLFRFPRFTEDRFQPYALAVGQATLAWNDLHEHMGRLFSMVVVTTGTSREQALAIWQALIVDRAKRQVLMAGVENLPDLDPWPMLKPDVAWLCERVNSLEDARNNIVHGPLALQVSLSAFHDRPSAKQARQRATVTPLHFGGNTRAKKMAGKDLLAEFRRVRDHAVALRTFAAKMDDALNDETGSWPTRPRGLGGDSPKTRPQSRPASHAVPRPRPQGPQG